MMRAKTMICESPDLWISAEYFASPRIEIREYETGRSFSFVVDAGFKLLRTFKMSGSYFIAKWILPFVILYLVQLLF